MNTDSSHIEIKILRETATGNESAFKALVDLYWQKVYCHALAYCRTVTEAEELTQDVFIAIWQNRQKLELIDNFPNYLFIITRNKIVKIIRKKLRETTITDKEQITECLWNPDTQMEYHELYQKVLKGIQLMPPMRRRVFMMSRLDGLSYQQICEHLEISRNTVKKHLVKALVFLRNFIAIHQSNIFFNIFTVSATLRIVFL